MTNNSIAVPGAVRSKANARGQTNKKSKAVHPMKFKQGLPILLVLIVGSLLALSLIFGKLGILKGAMPLSFLALANLGGGITLWLVSLAKGQIPKISPRVLEYGFMAGLLFMLPNMVGFLAVKEVGAGFLSLTFLFPLLLTYSLALLARLERFDAWRALAVLIGLSGGVLLAQSKASLGDAPLFWVLLTLSAPIIIAIGNLYRTLRWPQGVAPLFLASVMLLGAGILLLPIALYVEGLSGFAASLSEGAVSILALQIATFSLALYALFRVAKSRWPGLSQPNWLSGGRRWRIGLSPDAWRDFATQSCHLRLARRGRHSALSTAASCCGCKKITL